MDNTTQASGFTRLMRLFDNFLQEQNIKWVLGVGTLIVVGSSLMLVGPHWQQATPIWKYLIMLAYTGVVWLAGQWCYHRLLLRKTGTVLLGLSTLFFPILFAALNWVGAGASRYGMQVPPLTAIILFAVTLAMAIPMSGSVFDLFLRGKQPTFRAAYLTLAASASLAPLVPTFLAPLGALALWAVFSVGAVKVSRHVFWLVEERRAPRVVGFFPIAILGAQFLLVFALNFAAAIDVQWFGLGCAMVAVPILMTTDRLAGVFMQRTGDLVRPLPWSILLPLGVSLVLSAAGMAIAASGLAQGSLPYALVPTAILVAVCMALVARRTGKEPFVWLSIFAGLVAYNFSPVFFAELARQIVHAGAAAIAEEALPYAYYGLTYLPIIGALMGLAVVGRRRGIRMLERPARLMSLILSIGLLLVSMTHSKAVFPVAATMALVLAVQTVLFRMRAMSLVAFGAALLAAFGLAPFIDGVFGILISDATLLLTLAAVTAAAFVIGWRADGWLDSLQAEEFAWRPLQVASAVMTLLLGAMWLLRFGIEAFDTAAWGPLPLLSAVAIGGLLVAHSLRWENRFLAGASIIFGYVAFVIVTSSMGLSGTLIMSSVTGLALMHWLASYALLHRPQWRVARTFGGASVATAAALLASILVLVHVPVSLVETLGLGSDFGLRVPWVLRLLTLVWSFDAARRLRHTSFAFLGSVGALLLSSAVFMTLTADAAARYLPLLWVAVAAIAIPLEAWLRRRAEGSLGEAAEAYRALRLPIHHTAVTVFLLVGVMTLPLWILPLRIAGFAAVGALWLIGRRSSMLSDVASALAQWQMVASTAYLLTPAEVTSLMHFATPGVADVLLPVAFVATLLRVLVPHLRPEERDSDLLQVNRLFMGGLAGVLLVGSFALGHLDLVDGLSALALFGLLVFEQLYQACRDGKAWRVWLAELLAVGAVAYFAAFGVIHFGRGLSMFVVMGTAVLLWAAAAVAERTPRTAVLVQPFRTTAMILPAVTAVIGIYRHVVLGKHGWLGLNSLGLLLSAGFYFWQGIERRQNRLFVAAAAILNVSVMLLWNQLSWTDPQFYMIPIGITVLALTRVLREEIPAGAHDALYYAGALIILVSPTFHIVSGSWLHLFSLMVSSTVMVFVAIGLRLRALVYAGAGFLLADLVAIVVRGSIDRPSILWIAGLMLGAAVITLGALAERNREQVLQRMRLLTAELQTWS